jgi:hypothetical protein
MKKEKVEKTNGAKAAEIDLPDIGARDPVIEAVERELAAAEAKCARLGEVEQELSALREKVRGMEAERAKHTATLEAASEVRRVNAFNAADGDAGAQERLKKARAAQAEAALALEDQQSAIDEGRRRFEALEAEQFALAPSLQWRDAMKLAKQVLEESREIDVHLEPIVTILASHQEKLQTIRQLAQDSGREQRFRNLGLRQFMRVFTTRMAALWPLEFELHRQYQGKTYSDILKSQIAAGIDHSAAAQENEETGAAKADENAASA